MFLTRFRRGVDTYLPLTGRMYRSAREIWRRRFRLSRYGFRLAGAPEMCKEYYDIDQVSVFLDCMETHDVVLDIGANIGFYTCLASSRGKRVLAFEPSNRNLRFLLRNLWENEFRNVEVFPVGLGEQRGLIPLYGFGGISSVVPGWAQAGRSRFSVVPVTTLDSIIGTRFQQERLLIKVDVEGFELNVLRGAAAVLKQNPRPTWLIEILLRSTVIPGEVNTQFRDTFEVFWNVGYQCRTLDQNRSTISKEDVTRWQDQGFVDGDTGNFLFF